MTLIKTIAQLPNSNNLTYNIYIYIWFWPKDIYINKFAVFEIEILGKNDRATTTESRKANNHNSWDFGGTKFHNICK